VQAPKVWLMIGVKS